MGYFVKIDSNITRKYEEVGSSSFKNLLGFLNALHFQKTTYIGKDIAKETFFDTPEHLLARGGIILSKFEEGNNVLFKVENTAFLSKVLNKLEKEVYIHKIGYADKLSDHAFYLKDGITALFTTSFSIDLENVINNSIPNLIITTNAKIYSVVSGSGMRLRVALEKVKIKNLETKRSHKMQGITIKLDSENVSLFIDEFNKFNDLLQKNCKEYLITKQNQYDYAKNVTKPIVIATKEKVKKKKK